MMPPYVSVSVGEIVPAPLRAMPRLALRVIVVVTTRVPPPKASWPVVGEAGAAPSPESAAIDRPPAVMVVGPLEGVTPAGVRTSGPALGGPHVPPPSGGAPGTVGLGVL